VQLLGAYLLLWFAFTFVLFNKILTYDTIIRRVICSETDRKLTVSSPLKQKKTKNAFKWKKLNEKKTKMEVLSHHITY